MQLQRTCPWSNLAARWGGWRLPGHLTRMAPAALSIRMGRCMRTNGQVLQHWKQNYGRRRRHSSLHSLRSSSSSMRRSRGARRRGRSRGALCSISRSCSLGGERPRCCRASGTAARSPCVSPCVSGCGMRRRKRPAAPPAERSRRHQAGCEAAAVGRRVPPKSNLRQLCSSSRTRLWSKAQTQIQVQTQMQVQTQTRSQAQTQSLAA
mmetsp:Transcript_29640/g.87713  ORF Transcript_29640/g.87713 Transcript_29640/m.87713 type:complete len:207 (-) Transcript_29640:2790-3410(-)